MKKIFIAAMLVYCLLLFGCPKKSEAKKAAELSYQFSGLVLDLAKAAEKAFDSGLITLAQKDSAVTLIRGMNTGAKSFNVLATELAASSEAPAPDKLAVLNRILSNEVITPFLEVLKLFTGVNVPFVTEAISAIRIAILTISGTLSEFGVQTDRRLTYA